MRILHVIRTLDPRSGGPSHAIREMVRAQLDAGHRISILTTTIQSADPWAPAEEFKERMLSDPAFTGADVTLLPAYGHHRPWSNWGYTPGAARALSERFDDRSRRPEVVHIHGTFNHLTSLAARRSRRSGIPYVLRPAGSLNAKCLRMGCSRLKSLFIRLLLAEEMRHALAVQAMSDSEAAHLAAVAPWSRIRVVPHGIFIPPLLPREGNLFLERFPQLRGRTLILYLARLHAIKRPGLLVEVFARLQSEAPNSTLVLAGSDAGALTDVKSLVVQRGVADRVLFCGFLEGELKSAAFRAASVYALPSLNENFGVAVVEAMAHGTPVLVTPGVASHVYVDASGCGLTVADTADAVATGLRRLLATDAGQLGQRGRDYVIRHLAWPAVVRKLNELYLGREFSDQPVSIPA